MTRRSLPRCGPQPESHILLSSLILFLLFAVQTLAVAGEGGSRRRRRTAVAAKSANTAASDDKQRSSPRTPNVLFMFADDLGFDIAAYGHPYAVTPNIDRLAREGTRYGNFHVSGNTCNPSRTAIMTGRHPASYPNYMADFGFQGVRTVTEMAKDAGYRTGHFGKWHIGPDKDRHNGTYGIDTVNIIGGRQKDDDGRDAEAYGATRKFIRDHVTSDRYPEEPFYVNLWGHISHSPVCPPSEMVEKFKNVKVEKADFGHHMREKMDKFDKTTKKAKGHMQEYIAEVYSLDLQVGLILGLLDELNIRDETIIVFSSDHGPTPEYLGYAGPYRGGKHENYEGGLRVPFIVSWTAQDKVPMGKVNNDSLMVGLDWTPTLCRILKLDCDLASMEGEDMSDVWLGYSDRSRTAPAFWSVSSTKGWKAMTYRHYKIHSRGGKTELYNLMDDPEELSNRKDKDIEVYGAMKANLIEWAGTLPREYCKDECRKPHPFNPTELPVIGCPSRDLYELIGSQSARDEKEKNAQTEIYFWEKTLGEHGQINALNGVNSTDISLEPKALKIPTGAREGSRIHSVTVPAYPGKGKLKTSVSIPVAGDGKAKARASIPIPVSEGDSVRVQAFVGLDPDGFVGSLSFQIIVKFEIIDDDGDVKKKTEKGYAATVHQCARSVFAEYDRTMLVPRKASRVSEVTLKIFNLSPVATSHQVAFVADVSVTVDGGKG